MAFKFCDAMIHDYRTRGCVVFRQILPPSLLRDLRRATARTQEVARARFGPQVQRLKVTGDSGIDLQPFREYAELPALVDAVGRLLTPRHKIDEDFSRASVLLEPSEMPWCTQWHRDIRGTPNVPDLEEFERVKYDPLFFNQINCPLYEDNCTWYVPGSHLRDDLPVEVAAAEAQLPPEGTGYEERERQCLDYARNMPEAVRLCVDAGDLAIYHPNAWHLGNYLPDRRRVTIHDIAPTPELLDWYGRWAGRAELAQQSNES